MRRKLAVVGVLAALVVGGFAGAAEAKGKDTAPGQVCKRIDNTFPPDPNRPFPLEIQSDGGCASSVAQGFPGTYVLTGSAFASQCKFLEEVVPVVYPYAFYGNPDYLAKNRADCMYFLSAFHYGELPPGPG